MKSMKSAWRAHRYNTFVDMYSTYTLIVHAQHMQHILYITSQMQYFPHWKIFVICTQSFPNFLFPYSFIHIIIYSNVYERLYIAVFFEHELRTFSFYSALLSLKIIKKKHEKKKYIRGASEIDIKREVKFEEQVVLSTYNNAISILFF